MKKIIITTIFAFLFCMKLSAQNDGFFTYHNADDNRTGSDSWGTLPTLPMSHGLCDDYSVAPIGSGLFILGGLALFYARRKEK